MGLFTNDPDVVRAGSSYLSIVGPAYGLYGLGMGLYFATQGFGRVLAAVAANALRFVLSAGAGAAAVFWVGAGATGFFTAIAAGFVVYGVLTICAVLAVKPPERDGDWAGASFASTRNRGKPGMSVPEFARARRYIGPLMVALAVCTFMAVYNAGSASNDGRAKDGVAYRDLLNRYQSDDRDVLRMRTDAAHNRLWVLTIENVHVYDTATRMLLRRVRLPEWSVADFDYALPPDIALDHRGTAFISNNVEPRLLEVDPSTFQTKEHQLRLTSRKQWETGFGSLQFARDGTLLAVSTTGGAVFRIDLRNGNAQEIQSTSH
jgi:hypothetical protein